MDIASLFEDLSTGQWLIGGIVLFILWFLPAILAVFFNPKQIKLITIACIPAGLSVIAWTGVLLWSITGKAFHRFRNDKQKK